VASHPPEASQNQTFESGNNPIDAMRITRSDFFAIDHQRRRILHCNVTARPTADWVVL
jgi:hypothetical protein